MICPIRAKLESEFREASCLCEAARERFHQQMGISPKQEYERVKREFEAARKAMHTARVRLDKHIEEHGCKTNGACAG